MGHWRGKLFREFAQFCYLSAILKEKLQPSTLYLIATPIGNLADISLRAINILSQVDAIYCEDTRRALLLLRHHSIADKVPLVSCPQFKQQQRAADIVHRLQSGEAVAYISDAGTPGLCDPGAQLAQAVWQAGMQVRALPGASALLSALSACGWEISSFMFLGFLPRKNSARDQLLSAYTRCEQVLVFYEAPHRIRATLQAVTAIFGGATELCLARELTKMHESIVHSSAAAMVEDPQVLDPRGEYTVLVGARAYDNAAETQRQLDILGAELPHAQAAKLAAKLTGASRSYCYKYLLNKYGR